MPYYLYLSIGGEQKIARYALDERTGALTFQEDVPVGGSVMPLAVDPAGRYLYAGVRSIPEIQTYRLDPDTGGLTLLGRTGLTIDPCYLSVDRTGRYLLSAYYVSGGAAVHAIGEDGVAASPPVVWRETARGAHFVQTDPSNAFAFVPHVAESNVIHQFLFDERTGRLVPNEAPTVRPPSGAGPRHYCHHPGKHIVYIDNEQGNSVTAYHFDPGAGTLEAFQTVSTLPDGFAGESACAQIRIHPSGRFLYVSNRGHDSIACFAIDEGTGALRPIGQQPTEQTPRAFNLDPSGRFLFAAGQASGRLAAYRIDQETGALSPLATYAVGRSPSWVMVLRMGA
jgi:6-phosphogluconolactonase